MRRRNPFLDVWFLAALGLFILSTVGAYLQPPPAANYIRKHWFEWWLYPIERNVTSRLQTIEADLNSVSALPGGANLWVSGNTGLLARSMDGGATWKQLPVAANNEGGLFLVVQNLRYVFFSSPQRGWLVTSDDQTFSTQDGGNSWSLVKQHPNSILSAFRTDSTPLHWVVLANGEVVARPLTHTVVQAAGLFRIFMVDETSGAAVGEGGQVWEIRNNQLIPQIRPTKSNLRGVCITAGPGGRSEWVSGNDGEIYERRFGPDSPGAVWQKYSSGTHDTLNAVFFLNPSTGWVVGENGTILATVDGGRSWRPRTHPFSDTRPSAVASFQFAPWYYLTWAVWALPILSLSRRNAQKISTVSIGNAFTNDRALEEGDFDALEFTWMAEGISKFLRNEHTFPPLTIAITGDWGAGKTSIMNLVRGKLQRLGVRPVWFNAWHHQKEEHLFAALLESIRLQAIPPPWTYHGIVFWMRLLWIRRKRLVLAALVLALSAMFLLGLLQGLTGEESARMFAGLVSGIGALYVMYRSGPFRVNPSRLLASISKNSSLSDLEAQTSFRQKFAKDFREVTSALGTRSMTVFVDDLDRCRSEQILDVLESINFLVNSGECFVLLGLARERVENSIGLSLKDIAAEAAGPPGETEPELSARMAWQRRKDYASQYLDKLINIEIPVPLMDEQQVARVLVPGSATEAKASGNGMHLIVAPLVCIAALLLAVSLTYQSGAAIQQRFSEIWHGRQASVSVASTGQKISQQAAPAVLASTGDSQSSISSGPSHSDQPGDILPGQASDDIRTASLGLSAVLLLIVTGIYIGFRARAELDVVSRDSPVFVKALRDWSPVIFAHCKTPRSVKRFLNRVRYLAMVQPPSQASASSIPEDVLVALAAIHDREPAGVEQDPLIAGCLQVAGLTFTDLRQYGVVFRRLTNGLRLL